MKSKSVFLTALLSVAFLTGCLQAKEYFNQEVTNHVNQANEKVQQTIKDLGLSYVEEGAQDVINMMK
jgi:cytochrome c biogenesis protein ResB